MNAQAAPSKVDDMKFKVTLKAELGAGTLYWVSDIESDSEESAVAAAEASFLETLDSGNHWTFSDYDVISDADSDS